AIGYVSERSNAISENRELPVQNGKRLNPDTLKLEDILDDPRFDARHGPTGLWLRKNVLKHPADLLHCGLVAEARDMRFLPVIEWPQIVQTKNVVGMSMRIQNTIDALQTLSQRLLAEISRCINHQMDIAGFHKDR